MALTGPPRARAWYPPFCMITRTNGSVEAILPADQWLIIHNAADKQRARVYEITEAGRRYLEKEEQRWHEVTAAIVGVLKHA